MNAEFKIHVSDKTLGEDIDVYFQFPGILPKIETLEANPSLKHR